MAGDESGRVAQGTPGNVLTVLCMGQVSVLNGLVGAIAGLLQVVAQCSDAQDAPATGTQRALVQFGTSMKDHAVGGIGWQRADGVVDAGVLGVATGGNHDS